MGMVIGNKFLVKFSECSRFNRGPDPIHQAQIEVQVVQTDESQPENLV